MKMSLKVIQWNINGFNNNYSELQTLIAKHKPHILTLQETHILAHNLHPIPINYAMITLNSSPSYGGVAILIHKSIEYREITLRSDFDAICVEICSKTKLQIISTYIQPKAHFTLNNLYSVLNIANNIPTLITGDFNCWHKRWGSPVNNKKGITLEKWIAQSNLIILNDGSPTHLSTHNTLTHIDLSICTPELAIETNWTIETDFFGSDHLPILNNIFNRAQIQKPTHRPFFKTNSANWDLYTLLCISHNSSLPISSNINQEAANLSKIILRSAHKSIPKSTPKTSHTVPWWNKELEKLRKSKNKAWQLLKRNITTENIIDYRRKNALFRRTHKEAKKESTSKFTEEINPLTPIPKIWNNIRRLCGLNTLKGLHCIKSINSTDNITQPQDIAELFCQNWSLQSNNSNFTNSFTTNKSRILTDDLSYASGKAALPIENEINFIEFSSALNSLKGNTPGLDRINYSMIKALPREIKNRVINLYNAILGDVIPQQYKLSLIIPILKPNNEKTMISSYRPISLNSCVAKLLDKIVAKRLWWFITSNKLLHNSQVGFRKGKSVMDCLLFIDHIITKSLATKNHISIVSLDFSKAFEKIGIHAVIDQLIKWGVGPHILIYVKNFMTNRKIIVKVGKSYSKSLPLDNGIPQGSPLSVVLFVIAYQKLTEIISLYKEIYISAYADDFNLLIKLDKTKNTTINLDSLFCNISDWCNYSGGSLSPAKCKHMHICNKQNCICNVSTSQVHIPNVSSLKLLGVTFNRKHKWNPHIDDLTTCLSKRLDIIKCLASTKFGCSTLTLVSIVKSIIISKLDYALPLYGSAAPSSLKKIKSILNTAVRIALGAFRTTPTSNILFEANITPLDIRTEFLTTNLFQLVLNSSDSPLHNIIKNYKQPKPEKKHSVLDKVLKLNKSFNIVLRPPKKLKHKDPPWALNSSTINTTLSKLNKNTTPPEVYRKQFLQLKSEQSNKTSFVYTDGSQMNESTGYAITSETEVLKMGLLPTYSTVFSSELIAIHEAILLLKTRRGKFMICSDSLSSLNAIKNVNNNTYHVVEIRNLLIRFFPKFTLLWVPSHINITGNELADKSAKDSRLFPLTYTQNNNNTDLKNHIKKFYFTNQLNRFTDTSTWYKSINLHKMNIKNYLNYKDKLMIPRKDEIKLIRIRLGHTNLTHAHYMNKNASALCPFCNTNNSITLEHLLTFCPTFNQIRLKYFSQSSLKSLVTNPTSDNIRTIIKYLKECNIYHII